MNIDENIVNKFAQAGLNDRNKLIQEIKKPKNIWFTLSNYAVIAILFIPNFLNIDLFMAPGLLFMGFVFTINHIHDEAIRVDKKFNALLMLIDKDQLNSTEGVKESVNKTDN